MSIFSRSSTNTKQQKLRKASDLTDVSELQLDFGTRRRVHDGVMTTDALVKLGRDHFVERFGGRVFYRSWPDNLSSALDRAGFIRHDINDRTFLVGRLYKRIYVMYGLDTSRIFTRYDELTTNDRYEACQVVTDESFYHLMEYLDVVLGQKDAHIIKLIYGFETGDPWAYGKVGELYKTTGQCIRQTARKSLRTLAEIGLPPLTYPSL